MCQRERGKQSMARTEKSPGKHEGIIISQRYHLLFFMVIYLLCIYQSQHNLVAFCPFLHVFSFNVKFYSSSSRSRVLIACRLISAV